MEVDFLRGSVIAIVVLLVLIYTRVNAIFQKLTEKERRTEAAERQRFAANFKRGEQERAAWAKLSDEDKARFNDFHYEHAVGDISDGEYEAMKKELSEKTDGVL